MPIIRLPNSANSVGAYSEITAARVCNVFGKIVTNEFNSPVAASNIDGSNCDNISGIFARMIGATLSIICTIPPSAALILGMRLSTIVLTDATKLLICVSMDKSSLINATIKSCHAAFAEPALPEIVPAASSNVVPAMPICFCTTLIAFAILPNDMLFASTVIPNSF